MPTYQYACTACNEELEAVQSFTDAALTECPACQGQLRKVYSAVGVVFKGSGFYKNDSRSAAKGSESGTGSGKTSEGGEKTGSGTPSTGDKAGSSDTSSKGDKSPSPAKTESAKPAASTATTPASKSA